MPKLVDRKTFYVIRSSVDQEKFPSLTILTTVSGGNIYATDSVMVARASTKDAAEKFAEDMAKKHPGDRFYVMSLSSGFIATGVEKKEY